MHQREGFSQALYAFGRQAVLLVSFVLILIAGAILYALTFNSGVSLFDVFTFGIFLFSAATACVFFSSCYRENKAKALISLSMARVVAFAHSLLFVLWLANTSVTFIGFNFGFLGGVIIVIFSAAIFFGGIFLYYRPIFSMIQSTKENLQNESFRHIKGAYSFIVISLFIFGFRVLFFFFTMSTASFFSLIVNIPFIVLILQLKKFVQSVEKY
ncbi:MAG: hypothetical protein FWC69_00895 [Defluviitaleaceae bacterium]|nr:hypothetical protein [Defluviitaleaceae bacterium]